MPIKLCVKHIIIYLFIARKLSFYSSLIMAVQKTAAVVKLQSGLWTTSRGLQALEPAEGAPRSLPLPRRSRANLVVLDSREVVVPKLHRTSAP